MILNRELLRSALLVLILLLIHNQNFSQKKITEVLYGDSNKYRAPSEFGNTINAADLIRHVYILADSAMEGRGGATTGERKAAAYISAEFNLAGLLPGALNGWKQLIPFYKDSVETVELTVSGRSYKPVEDFFYDHFGNLYSQDIEANEVVFVRNGDLGDYNSLEVSGKIVIMTSLGQLNNKKVLWDNFELQRAIATKKGVKALLVVNDEAACSQNHRNLCYTSDPYVILGGSDNDSTRRSVNLYFISSKIAAHLFGISVNEFKNRIENKKLTPGVLKKPIHLRFVKKRIKADKFSANIVGFLQGSDRSDELVIVTAHYDHRGKHKIQNNAQEEIFYGADDNASGVSSLIEVAKAFSVAKSCGKGPRRSIVFIAFSCEEDGLLGSRYYIESNLYPIDKTIVNLNIDMIGRTGYTYIEDKDSTNYVYTIGDDRLSRELKHLSDSINLKYTMLKLDNSDNGNYYTRSDHYVFAQENIPVIYYTNGVHADYHTSGDIPQKINFELLYRRTQLVFYTAWEIANRDSRIRIDKK